MLTIEESTLDRIPKHFEKLLNSLDKDEWNKQELFVLTIYGIALEMGFVPSSLYEDKDYSVTWSSSFSNDLVQDYARLPMNYRQHDGHLYRFDLLLCKISSTPCTLIAVKSSDCLCLTLSRQNKPGYSILLSISRYVPVLSMEEPSKSFRYLSELSRKLKDSIFTPTRNELLLDCQNHFPGLNGIPTELLWSILSYLNLKDLQHVSQTCYALRLNTVNYLDKTNRNVEIRMPIRPTVSSTTTYYSALFG